MQGRMKTTKTLKLTTMVSILIWLTGCSEAMIPAQNHLKANRDSQSIAVPNPIADIGSQPVRFEVCGNLPDWERPDLRTQEIELANNPRYNNGLDEEPLKSLFDKFWTKSIITFTSYGLSARIEPIYLSGIWTAINAMEACYEGDRPNAINVGHLAEMWLIKYQVISMDWTGDHYAVTVEPTSRGLQFIQFERFEENDFLPLLVTKEDGMEVMTIPGDW